MKKKISIFYFFIKKIYLSDHQERKYLWAV